MLDYHPFLLDYAGLAGGSAKLPKSSLIPFENRSRGAAMMLELQRVLAHLIWGLRHMWFMSARLPRVFHK